MATDLFQAGRLTADGNLPLLNLRGGGFGYGSQEWHQIVIPAAGVVLPAAIGGGTQAFGGGTVKLQLFYTKLNAWLDALDPTTGLLLQATLGPVIWPVSVVADDYRILLSGSTSPVIGILWI